MSIKDISKENTVPNILQLLKTLDGLFDAFGRWIFNQEGLPNIILYVSVQPAVSIPVPACAQVLEEIQYDQYALKLPPLPLFSNSSDRSFSDLKS